MPKLTFSAPGGAMPDVEGMHIITGRFSRRAMLIGAIASISAAGAVVAAPTLPAALTFAKRRASIEARLALLPPDVAARLREQFCQMIDHVYAMQESGADTAAIKSYLAGVRAKALS